MSTKSTITQFYRAFRMKNPDYASDKVPSAWHFCNNQKDANELASLVLEGLKEATCSLHLEYEAEGESLPVEGQLDIIIDWEKNPQAMIRTTKVELVKYQDITAAFAKKEGEGDRSLVHWQKVHKQFFTELCKSLDAEFKPDMLLACQYFELIWPKK